MIQLTNEQIEKRDYNFARLKGRTAVIDNSYITSIPNGTKVTIYSYSPEKGMFRVLYGDNQRQDAYCCRDEFNLIDKEFSDYKILKKGIRIERKDKFGDRFIIELLNNKRDIFLSAALVSLLNLNDEENYVGFGADPDTGVMYIFKADKISGYLLNKNNNRITSTADWRELFQIYEKVYFEVVPRPIVDNENPGFVFYVVNPSFDNFENGKNVNNNQTFQKQNNNKTKKVFYENEEMPQVNWEQSYTNTIGNMYKTTYASGVAPLDPQEGTQTVKKKQNTIPGDRPFKLFADISYEKQIERHIANMMNIDKSKKSRADELLMSETQIKKIEEDREF